jgi:hypothetical protein
MALLSGILFGFAAMCVRQVPGTSVFEQLLHPFPRVPAMRNRE